MALPIRDADLSALGVRLRELRAPLGLNGKALAGRAGLSASTLTRIEYGQILPTRAQLVALACVLGVELRAFEGL